MAQAVLIPLAISAALSAAQLGLSYLLRPKVKPTDQGKMDDIRITAPAYGAFIPRLWGQGRLSGNMIFSSGVEHYIIQTPTGGGKGVPQAPATRTHVYQSDIGVLVCRGPITNWLRIWQDADLVLNNGTWTNGNFEAEDATLAGGASIDTDAGASGGEFVENLGNGGKATFNFTSIPDPPFPSPDPDEDATPNTKITMYYRCNTALTATLTLTDATPSTLTVNFPATGGDWTVQTVFVNGFCDTLEFANASAAAPDLDLIRVEKFYLITITPGPELPIPLTNYRITGVPDPNIIYPTNLDDPGDFYNYDPETLKNGTTGTYALTTSIPGEAIRYYTGTTAQTADSAIQAWLDGRYGTGNGVLYTSAMRGLAWVMFDNFTLKNGRVPNFTFELMNGDNEVNDVLADMFADVGLVSGDYDITATNSLSQVGFIEHNQASPKSWIEQLARYHFFNLAEIDGKIKTVLDTPVSTATIDIDDLRAHAAGEEMPKFDADVAIKESHLLPREVRVSIMNPNLDYHNDTATAQLFASLPAKESVDYAMSIVDPLSNARTVAEKRLLKEHAEDMAFEFYGMPGLAEWSIGDVLTVPINGTNQKMRVEKKQMTLPLGKIRFQCVRVQNYSPSAYADDTTTRASLAARQLVNYQFPRNTIVFAFESVPIRDSELDKFGLYLAISGRGRGYGDSAALYREYDDDNYIAQEHLDAFSPVGLCAGTLGNHASGPTVEDTTNTLDIWFFNAIDLETVLQADIDKSPLINLIRVGDEWIQFRTATAQTLEANSPYRAKWRISNLWRGRFYTQGEISGHGSSEYAALVTPALKFIKLDSSDIGKVVRLKAVTSGQDIDNAPVTSVTFAGTSGQSVLNDINRTLTAADSGRVFSLNVNIPGTSVYTLPTGARGLNYAFLGHPTEDSVTINAANGETINLGDARTIADGYISNKGRGYVKLVWTENGWWATDIEGDWNVETS